MSSLTHPDSSVNKRLSESSLGDISSLKHVRIDTDEITNDINGNDLYIDEVNNINVVREDKVEGSVRDKKKPKSSVRTKKGKAPISQSLHGGLRSSDPITGIIEVEKE
ncbi:hypothetical protein Glove_29g188 [Diversispora epigaea]|uniref:Uncharacterized protein n=1 Tax=Diversispora epigaea TaxID=1348612 RepID=A0A397JIP5_9GLOM|nr:hypothetical protein Glove_29g188 [Diversispora epigaea]